MAWLEPTMAFVGLFGSFFGILTALPAGVGKVIKNILTPIFLILAVAGLWLVSGFNMTGLLDIVLKFPWLTALLTGVIVGTTLAGLIKG